MIKVRSASLRPQRRQWFQTTCRYFPHSAYTNHSDRYLRSSSRYPDRGVPVGPACWYCRPGSARLAPLRPCPSPGLWIYACANFPFLLSRHSSDFIPHQTPRLHTNPCCSTASAYVCGRHASFSCWPSAFPTIYLRQEIASLLCLRDDPRLPRFSTLSLCPMQLLPSQNQLSGPPC